MRLFKCERCGFGKILEEGQNPYLPYSVPYRVKADFDILEKDETEFFSESLNLIKFQEDWSEYLLPGSQDIKESILMFSAFLTSKTLKDGSIDFFYCDETNSSRYPIIYGVTKGIKVTPRGVVYSVIVGRAFPIFIRSVSKRLTGPGSLYWLEDPEEKKRNNGREEIISIVKSLSMSMEGYFLYERNVFSGVRITNSGIFVKGEQIIPGGKVCCPRCDNKLFPSSIMEVSRNLI